jgi:hypothetical protein
MILTPLEWKVFFLTEHFWTVYEVYKQTVAISVLAWVFTIISGAEILSPRTSQTFCRNTRFEPIFINFEICDVMEIAC